jgi:hypothetical protein
MNLQTCKPIVALILLLTSLGVAGCSGGKGAVSGKVTYAGKPVVFGVVLMVGKDSMPVRGEIDPDGNYTVKDVPYGDIRVAVNSPMPRKDRWVPERNLPEEVKKHLKEPPKGDASIGAGVDMKKWFELPSKYASHDTSEVSVKVNQKLTTFDIELKPTP